MKKYGIIYLVINIVNKKVYIGQTTAKEGFRGRYPYAGSGITRIHKSYEYCREKGKYYNSHLLNAIEYYGEDNFIVFEELDLAYSKRELDLLEKSYISYFNATDSKCGYNSQEGGKSHKLNEESKAKIRKKATGRKASIITRKKLSQKNSGKGNPMYGIRLIGEKHWNYGKHWDDSYKEKQRVAHLGKKMPDGFNKYENNPNSKKVYCITTGKVFNSLSEAGDEYGIDKSCISKVCRGKRKTVKGLTFTYYVESI